VTSVVNTDNKQGIHVSVVISVVNTDNEQGIHIPIVTSFVNTDDIYRENTFSAIGFV
jgi:hypothetical protein